MITKRVNTISDSAHSQTAQHSNPLARENSTVLIEFTKMHGLGNDFVVIDAISQSVSLTPQKIRQIADRHFGIGCDQVLLAERPQSPKNDFRYRIFNADGGEVEQCGNGARCFAAFVRDRGLTRKDHLAVETAAGIIHPTLRPDGQVSVEMGTPRFDPKDIPFIAEQAAASYPLSVGDRTLSIGAVSMGNPHAVLSVGDVSTAPVATLGPQIEHHPRFPKRVNAGFMQILDRGHIRLRVYERGAGETLACGTGACAAVVIGIMQGHLDQEVAVDLPGGRLLVNWAGGNAPVLMTGPCARVFEGKIEA